MSAEQLPPPAAEPQSEMTFWEHLDELRSVLVRIVAVAAAIGLVFFALKEYVFDAVLAPASGDFVTYRWINRLLDALGLVSMRIPQTDITLINTELSAQFMTHVTVAATLGLLASAPYVVWQLFGFVRPALYEHERRNSDRILVAATILFFVGVAMNYFVIFPVSVRFLGTYQVSESVVNTITLSSYISTLATLSLMMGLVFEIPVLAYFFARASLVSSALLARYRKHSFIIIMIVSAVITPPDIFTLILMCFPLYGLYEVSIAIARRVERKRPAE